MEEIKSIVISTLYNVAMELAEGKSTNSIEELEHCILLLEVQADNTASECKPVEDLDSLRQQLINLQTHVFRYATE